MCDEAQKYIQVAAGSKGAEQPTHVVEEYQKYEGIERRYI